MTKSSVDEIRARFDAAVEHFSNLETGQTTTVDGALALDLITQSISAQHSTVRRLCDIGCGAGNFALRILAEFPRASVTLIDLSEQMLARARKRMEETGYSIDDTMQSDIRNVQLPPQTFDVVVAAAVLHHLRTRDEWRAVLSNIFQSLCPGGSFWVWDLVRYENEALQRIQTQRYAEYLRSFKDEAFQHHVFEYIEKEDTPESVSFITDAMRAVGFSSVEVIHQNTVFAAICAMR